MSRVAIILLILIENVMTSSFYTTTWIDVELRTHCKVRGYQDSNYHRTGSEAYGCVTITIYNNKLLMLCSIM